MKGKIFWFDVETSGIDPKEHALLTLGGVVEMNDQIVDQIDLKFRPYENAKVAGDALEKNNLTIEEIMKFPPPRESLNRLRWFLKRFVNKYDRDDKLVLAGYNTPFDINFLRAAFLKENDNYFGSWFFWPSIDAQNLVAEMVAKGLRLPNYQLETVCKHYEIEIEAHKAISDIIATRDLYLLLKAELK